MSRFSWPRKAPDEITSLERTPVDAATLATAAKLIAEVESGGEASRGDRDDPFGAGNALLGGLGSDTDGLVVEEGDDRLDPSIFRAYDIRGVIDKTLDSGIAHQIGQAVGSAVLERDAGPVVVARDGRLSGPYLMKGVIEGLVSTGCDVIDIGAAPTGVLYYAAHEYAKGSAIVITGSHNPPDYNGFKIMVGGDTLHGDAIKDLYRRIEAGDLATGEGKHERMDVIPDYIERIAADVKVEKPLRVVIDCGNGIGGVCAADTLRALGVEVLPHRLGAALGAIVEHYAHRSIAVPEENVHDVT